LLLYSHDTYGLGHLRRSLLLAGRLAALPQRPSVLIATGSPRAQSFALPQGCDTIKLPAVTKDPAGGYKPRTLSTSLSDVTRLRSGLILTAFRAFQPDVVLVDHAPLGMVGELLPLIEEVHRTRPRSRLVLGLRDVIDEADRVRDEWDAMGVWPVLREAYHRVLVYGDATVTTTALELELPDLMPGKVQHVGYLGRPMRPLRRRANGTRPTVLVTAGGGGDGQRLLRGYADFLHAAPPSVLSGFRSVVVTGPLLSRRRRVEVEQRLRSAPGSVEVRSFTNRMDKLVAQSASVVSMAGYNSVVEILSARRRALLVPRLEPRREQAIRARRLDGVAGLEASNGDEVADIAAFVARTIDAPPPPPPGLRLDGVDGVAAEISDLLDQEESSVAS